MMNNKILSTTFISPTGRLCKTLILFGKELYTMLDVEPDCLLNMKALTSKEILELNWQDFGLSSNRTYLIK